MTDPVPIGWRVSIVRTGTYAAARQKPEQHEFPDRARAEAYAAEMRAPGLVVCITPRFLKPYQRGAKR